MAEQNLESDQLEGSEGTTNSNASQNVGDKPTSTFNAEELLNKMRDTIKEEVGRATQSTKDKRFSEIEKKLGDFQPVLERFKDLVSPEKLKEIERDLLFEDMKQRVYGQTGETVSAGNAQAPAVNAAQVFSSKGLDVNDPRVAVALNKTYSNATDAELAAYKLKESIQSSPSPTPAQSATPLGSAPVAPDASALKQSYIQEVTAARGNKSLIRGIQQKYQQQGLDPGSVDFRL